MLTIFSWPLLLLSYAPLSHAHMYMSLPKPRGSPDLPSPVNYDLSAPASQPCQGLPRQHPQQDLTAGKALKVQMSGGASHGGGHCQFALSFNQKDWVVLYTVLDDCLIGSLSYDIPIPSNTPQTDNAIFAWTWINRLGNREFYWNCADVRISGPSAKSLSGPSLLVANILGGPIIPEWNSEDKVGKRLLEQRPLITISPGGGGGGGGGGKDFYPKVDVPSTTTIIPIGHATVVFTMSTTTTSLPTALPPSYSYPLDPSRSSEPPRQPRQRPQPRKSCMRICCKLWKRESSCFLFKTNWKWLSVLITTLHGIGTTMVHY